MKETQLSEQKLLIEKGLQEKDGTICEMETRLEEKEKDAERNCLKSYKQLNLTKKEVMELADFQTRSDTEKKRMLELVAIKSIVEEKLQVMENIEQLSEEKDDGIEKLQEKITNLEEQYNELNRKIRIIVKRNKDLERTNSRQRGNLEKMMKIFLKRKMK